ncbi:Origin recognition complex subunit 2 [Thelohanellus kitauei]|uniref:Origin recognition complex subunit 2 n=1 Tax=Thelohanellus kitauei TaxID=669202 RepID=A0A0C2MJS0_THEKT|nr:Origin recognition complex subunit 2 [Thelohanellus kitauei]
MCRASPICGIKPQSIDRDCALFWIFCSQMVQTRKSLPPKFINEAPKINDDRKRKRSKVNYSCIEPPKSEQRPELPEYNYFFKSSFKKIKPDNIDQDFSFLQDKSKVFKVKEKPKYLISFKKLHKQLRCGFNIILHGPGSKLNYTSGFIKFSTDLDFEVLEINGYLEINKKNFVQVLENFIGHRKPKLLVVNCIDRLFAKLDACSEIFRRFMLENKEKMMMVVTVDTVNASSMWSTLERLTLNWIYNSLPTFEPYIVETSNQPPLLGQKLSQQCIESLTNVIKSLSPKFQEIFKLMAETHLEMIEMKEKPIIKFSSFYEKCRSKFLVSKEQNFKLFLIELMDHKVLKSCEVNSKFSSFQITYSPDTISAFLTSYQPEAN